MLFKIINKIVFLLVKIFEILFSFFWNVIIMIKKVVIIIVFIVVVMFVLMFFRLIFLNIVIRDVNRVDKSLNISYK